jgi:hypothetical protein
VLGRSVSFRRDQIPDDIIEFFEEDACGTCYVCALVSVFREVKRVLRSDGTLWLNLGSSYGPDKCDLMVPSRVALALIADGWILRSPIIWEKPNPMPESVRDRPTSAHEHVFLLTKRAKYFFDAEAIREPHETSDRTGERRSYKPGSASSMNGGEHQAMTGAFVGLPINPAGRNKRNVWTIATAPFSDWTQTSRQVRVEPGDADDDTTRITSPDCPIHAGQPDSVPTPRGDERAAGRSRRTPGNGARPDQAPPLGFSPTGQRPGEDSAGESWDSLPLLCGLSATGHSNGSYKTDLGPATSPACTPSAQTIDRTDDTSALPVASGSVDHTPESSNGLHDSGESPSPETNDRTAHTSSEHRFCEACTSSYYKTSTESISHFATFPPKLVEPMILAGTSAKGCCPACGSPWVRVVERTAARADEGAIAAMASNGVGRQTGNLYQPHGAGFYADSKTTGWSPSCACPAADPIPCTVLDPFGGAGTVGLVADRLGRDAILIELNESYARMAEDRIRGAAPMFAAVEVA